MKEIFLMKNKSDFVIKTYNHSELPNTFKENLAIMMKSRHMEFSDMPVHHLNYYLKPLSEEDYEDIRFIYVLALEPPIHKKELTGYAMLEYRKTSENNQKDGSLQIYVKKDKRNRGCGTQLLHAITKVIPDHLTTINMHAEKDSISSKILQKILQVEKAYESKHYYSLIRELNIQTILELEKKINEELENRGLEIVYTNSNSFSKYKKEYANLLEVIWNVGKNKSEFETFSVERLQGRMQYFKEHLNIFVHTFFLRNKNDNSFVAIAENVIYESNEKVADEAIIGGLEGYKDDQIIDALRIKSLLLLLQETQVTHWESSQLRQTENQQLHEKDKIFGFKIGKMFNRYKISTKKFV